VRKPIVAGNWKMNKTTAGAAELAAAVRRDLAPSDAVEAVLCPPFTALPTVRAALAGSAIGLGAQNMHWEKEGAFTGEICAAMLLELGCRYVILGHSERRAYFQETDEMVNRKVKAALAAGLTPIVCVGETLEQREKNATRSVVTDQVTRSLAGLGVELRQAVIAYEPVWAIGTGRTATPAQAQEVHALIRETLAKLAGKEAAGAIRIQYGGSVKSSNAAELFAQPDIDGALIGGASLEAPAFVQIVKAAAPLKV
jgi:triosephosphate isomerase